MTEKDRDKVPLFRTWTQWYVLVVICLALFILFFYLFTQRFA